MTFDYSGRVYNSCLERKEEMTVAQFFRKKIKRYYKPYSSDSECKYFVILITIFYSYDHVNF